MQRRSVFTIAALVSALALPVLAQEEGGTITRGYRVKVKPGMEMQFEEAYKKHIAWHRQHKDTWAWETYVYESGDRLGQYVIITGGHQWSDFDSRGDMGKADRSDFAANGEEFVESVTGWYSRTHLDVSRVPTEADDAYSILQVTNYSLNSGHEENFLHVLAKYRQACEKTNRPNHYVLIEALTGDDRPLYTVVSMEKNWAGLEPVDQSVGEMMREVYGSAEAEAIRQMWLDAVRSQRRDIVRYLPELSYRPASRPTTE